MRGHLWKQVRGDQFDPSGQSTFYECLTHRKTIDRVHVKSREIRKAREQLGGLLKTFDFVFMTFEYVNDLKVLRIFRKRLREAVGFLTMIFRRKHADHNRHLRI